MILLLLDILEWARTDGSVDHGPLRVFQYITVRAAGALVVAFIVSLVAGPSMIARLKRVGARQIIRTAKKEDAISLQAMHGQKEGTPTMGGLLIMLAMLVAILVFGDLTHMFTLLLVAVSLAFAALGFADDYAKIAKKNHLGISARGKLAAQISIGLALGAVLWLGDWPVVYPVDGSEGYDHLLVPLFKDLYPKLGFGFVALSALVMACTSNAVNLTDGLDGLAIGVTLATLFAFTMIAYLASRADYSAYLFIPHIGGAGEVVVFGGAMIGASMGFLWFNSHPAEVFMGDTGSMMLGGALGAMALVVKQELLLVLIGGVFVIEALSVIIQVTSYKTTGKRVFRMSPIHHHFEKLGLHENKIIIRFWTISVLLALFGIATLKLR